MFRIQRIDYTSSYSPSIFTGNEDQCLNYIHDLIQRDNRAVRGVSFFDGSDAIELTNNYGSKYIYKIVPL